MATPLEQLRAQKPGGKRRVKIGGKLQEVTDEALQNLSQAAGRAAPPISPHEAAAIGAPPDVAKMAGAAPQKVQALRQSIQEGEDLQTTLRREQPRKEATTAEQQRIDRAAKLQGLAQLGAQTQAAVTSVFNPKTGQAEPVRQLALADGEVLDEAMPADATDADKATLRDVLPRIEAAYNATPPQEPSAEDFIALNKALGRTTETQLTKASEIMQFFQGAQQLAQQGIAEAITGEAEVKQLALSDLPAGYLADLGFESPVDLADALGINESELAEMTVAELQNTVATLQAEELDQVAELQRRARDRNLGPAERAEAQNQLRAAGAVGVRAAEEEFEEMEMEMAAADIIEFGGQEYDIEELLSDEKITSIIADYFENPDTKVELEKTEPDFVKWIEGHQNALQIATAGLGEDIAAFGAVQLETKKVTELPPELGVALDDETKKILLPGSDDFVTEVPEPTAFLNVLKKPGVDPTVKKDLIKGLNALATESPDIAKQVANLDSSKLDGLGLLSKDGMQSYAAYVSKFNDLNELDISTSSGQEALLSGLFGPGTTVDNLGQSLKELYWGNKSGVVPMDGAQLSLINNLITEGPDGGLIIADADKIKDSVFKHFYSSDDGNPLSVQDMLEQGIRFDTSIAEIPSLEALEKHVPKTSFIAKLGDFWEIGPENDVRASDNFEETSNQIREANLPLEDLRDMRDFTDISEDRKSMVNAEFEKKVGQAAEAEISKLLEPDEMTFLSTSLEQLESGLASGRAVSDEDFHKLRLELMPSIGNAYSATEDQDVKNKISETIAKWAAIEAAYLDRGAHPERPVLPALSDTGPSAQETEGMQIIEGLTR